MIGARFKPYPAYRDCSIEWLGMIPAHWDAHRLKHIATINDEALPEDTDPDYEISYIDIGNVDAIEGIVAKEFYRFEDAPSRARRIIRDGDIVVSTVRTYLRAIASIVDPEPNLIVSTGFAVIRPRPGLDSRFASYSLRSPYFVERVVAESVGVSYPAINAWQLGTFWLALPSEHVQQTIADFLDRETTKIDALVAKKERLIELLQEKRTAMITHAVTKGLDPNIPMKDSGIEWLGQIPAHWKPLRLKHLLKAQKSALKTGPFGSQLQSSEMTGEAIKVYNQKNVIRRDVSGGDNYISMAKFEDLRAFEVFEDDLLVTTRGTIGRCMILPPEAERGILHPCLMRIQIEQSLVLNRYLEMLIQDSDQVLNQLRLMSNATTIDVIYSEPLREVWLAVPPIQEQQSIADFLDRKTARLDALIAKVKEAIERLKEYRTALISAAVTGKIDVRNE